MPSPRTDVPAQHRLPSMDLRGRLQRLVQQFNVRLVFALWSVALVGLIVSALAINQILPDYFREQARERIESAALSVALVTQEIADAQRERNPNSTLVPELRRNLVFDNVVELAAGPLIPATVAIYEPPPIGLQSEETPRDTASLQAEGLHLDSEIGPFDTGLIPLRVSSDGATVPYRIVISDPWTSREATLEQIRSVIVAAGIVALLVSLLLGVLVARRITAPIYRLRRVASHVAQGNIDERATASGVLEVDELAAQFNVMADRLAGTLRMLEADRDRLREFVADVSHELRTPIAALRMYTELQLDGDTDEPTRHEFLVRSTEQIRRLEWLSTNLLDLSRIDAGIFPLDVRTGDLRDPIQSVVQAMSEVADERGVALESVVPGHAVELRFDRERIVQLLTNLVGNGLKFTPRGGAVEVELTDAPGGATIEVRDTGPGIPEEELPHIFERFYRGTNTGEARASGSGLGLAIVRSIVEMHGGEVDVASVVGQGTAFRVTLPRTPEPATAGAEEKVNETSRERRPARNPGSVA